MARILITGAHGFIGKHLARHLAGCGHHVSGLGHGIWPVTEAAQWGIVEWLNGDVQMVNLRSLQAHGEPEVVFHLAGGSSVGASIANPREDFCRTVDSTVELLEWIRQDVPRARLIAVSSAAVYGSGYTRPIAEESVTKPFSPYGYHKRMMELLCHSYGETYDLDFRIVRLFSVYGPELKKQLLWDVCTRIAAGENPLVLGGTGEELRDWIHVQDIVAALALVAFCDNPLPPDRTINIGTGNGIPVKRVAQIIIDAWYCRGSSAAKTVLTFSGRSRPGDPFSLVADSRRLMGLGFQWETSLDEGVGSYVDWFRRVAVR
ncbi:MAG TPA: NAD(P)-dependent oxidoreductase [Methylococcus sp.]|nr:NAD(P)-dependent oxidoreductase [Methylococcus sp.]